MEMRLGSVGARRDRAKERKWRAVLRRQARSGLAVRSFCLTRGISQATFYYWRRELAIRDTEYSAANTSAAAATDNDHSSSTGQRGQRLFTQVVVARDGESPAGAAASLSPTRTPAREVHGGGPLAIVLPGERRVEVPAGVDRQTLRDVLAALGEPSC